MERDISTRSAAPYVGSARWREALTAGRTPGALRRDRRVRRLDEGFGIVSLALERLGLPEIYTPAAGPQAPELDRASPGQGPANQTQGG